jgi:hypothetical protein
MGVRFPPPAPALICFKPQARSGILSSSMDIKPPRTSRPNPPSPSLRRDDLVTRPYEPVKDKEVVHNASLIPEHPHKRAWYRRIGWWWLAIILALITLAGGGVWYVLAATKPTETTVSAGPAKSVAVSPTTVPAPLTGEQVTADQASKPIIGVMIENLNPDARPQSGLGSAGVVYEALAEGGITRFLALFQAPLPASIGPVRSLRPYYLDWALEYGIPVAHAGGSIPALAAVGTQGLKDIDALRYDGSYFFRTNDKAAPHNMYTTNVLLEKLDAQLGFNTAPSFTQAVRKADTPSVGVAPHPTININFSYSDYAVKYAYDPATDSYARFMAGTPHVDKNTGKQIMVKNVVVEYVPTTYGTQSNGKPETNLSIVGTGKALVFEDGNVVPATWSKASASAPTLFTDATGLPIKFNVGNTWFSVVPTTNTVTY